MKTLLLILGPNAVGKTTAAHLLLEMRPRTALVDADWCRAMNPFILTPESAGTVADNLFCLLYNYLSCPSVDTVVMPYALHGGRAERFAGVLRRLDQTDVSYGLKKVILTAEEEAVRERALKDGRDEERIERGIQNTLHFYDDFAEIKIETTHLKPKQVAQRILVQGLTQWRELTDPNEITRRLFLDFHRRQEVSLCWRKERDQWVIKADPFVDDWTEADYEELVRCLKRTVRSGGFVYGAFMGGLLKGFVSVESCPFGGNKEYLDLSCIHVSQELRGAGIGRRLFAAAAQWAREKGASKLYISAHSADETQKFYRSLGCQDAQELNREHVEKEPYDCQLEYKLF